MAVGGSIASKMMLFTRGSSAKKREHHVSAFANMALADVSSSPKQIDPHVGTAPGAPRHHPVVVAISSARMWPSACFICRDSDIRPVGRCLWHVRFRSAYPQ